MKEGINVKFSWSVGVGACVEKVILFSKPSTRKIRFFNWEIGSEGCEWYFPGTVDKLRILRTVGSSRPDPDSLANSALQRYVHYLFCSSSPVIILPFSTRYSIFYLFNTFNRVFLENFQTYMRNEIAEAKYQKWYFLSWLWWLLNKALLSQAFSHHMLTIIFNVFANFSSNSTRKFLHIFLFDGPKQHLYYIYISLPIYKILLLY